MKISKLYKEIIANLNKKVLTIEIEDSSIENAIKDFLKIKGKEDYKDLFSYALELIGLEKTHYCLRDYNPSTNSFKCYLNDQFVLITLEDEKLTISSLESQKTYKFVNENNQNKAVLISAKVINKVNNNICNYTSSNEYQYYTVNSLSFCLTISLKGKNNMEVNPELYSYLGSDELLLDAESLFNKLKEFLNPSDFFQIIIKVEQRNSKDFQLSSLLTYQDGDIQVKNYDDEIIKK